jgi:hypothetical protein
MSFTFLPLLVVWAAFALTVLALFIWRQAVSNHEDDSLHLTHGVLTQQTSFAQKLDAIDKWGKIMTVITVVFGFLIAAAFVYGQLVGRGSLG